MAGFVGRYEHSLDTKGRVILPAKFRGQFERGGYLTQNSEGCLALWTPGEFERQMEAMQEKSDAGRADRNRARIWASNSAEVEIDRQGRMPIPAHLRTFAQLEAEVLVHGAIDRVELWNPAAWAERVLPEESWLLGRRGLATLGDDDRPIRQRRQPANNRGNRKDTPHDPEHDDTRYAERTGPCAAPRPARWKATPPTSTLVVRNSTSLSTHRPRGCRWPTRSNTFPCCATKWSRCSHPCPPGWWSTRPSAAAGMPRPCWRPTQHPAHRRAGPRSRRTRGGPGAACRPSGTGSTLVAAPFSTLESVLSGPGLGPLAGVLFDLGVSSPQLDWSERGFSFREDGPLDMRMDPTSGPTAADLVNGLPVDDLAALFRENGEGRLVRAHRPSGRGGPATDLDEAAGRSRGVGRAGAGPPEGSSGPAGVPGTAHAGERRAGPAGGCAARRPVASGRRRRVRGDQLPLR